MWHFSFANKVTIHSRYPARDFDALFALKSETASAKISVLCLFCVHNVAMSSEAVNSNKQSRKVTVQPGHEKSLIYNDD